MHIITPSSYALPILVMSLLSFSFSPVAAMIFTVDGELTESELYELTNCSALNEEKTPVVFLYDPNCSSCVPAHDYLVAYLADHPDVEVTMLNLHEGSEGKETYDRLKKAFNREKVFIPVMYLGPVGLEGSPSIMEHFEDVYWWYTQ